MLMTKRVGWNVRSSWNARWGGDQLHFFNPVPSIFFTHVSAILIKVCSLIPHASINTQINSEK